MLPKYDEVARLSSYSGVLTPEYFKYLNDNVIPFYTKWYNSDGLINLSSSDIFNECNPRMYSSDMEDFLNLISRRYNVDNVTFDNFVESINGIINDKDFQRIMCYDALEISTNIELNIRGISPFVFYFLNRLCILDVSTNYINSVIKSIFPMEINLYWLSILDISLKPRIIFNPELFEFMDDVEKMKGFTITDMLVGLKMILDDNSYEIKMFKRSYSLAIFIGWLYFNIESRLDDTNTDNRVNILRKIINY